MSFFRVTQERIKRRADYLRTIGVATAEEQLFKDAGVTFDPAMGEVLAQGCFMLSESYRTYRSRPDHLINTSKIAAIATAVITTLDPMRVENPDPHNTVHRYANPIFALRCGMTMVNHPFHTRNFDELRRIYDKMLVTQFPCLQTFTADVDADSIKPPEDYNKAKDKFTIGISQKEMADLETYVSMYAVFREMKIYK